MANASSDAEDRKLWPLPIEKHFIDVLVEEQLKGNMQPAQSAPNSDEEQELDEGFLSAGVRVYLEADSGDDIEELITPIEEQSRCTEKHVAQPEHSKGKKKKGEILSEMNEAIKRFMEVSKVRLIANESRKQTGESFVGGDRFSIDKAVEVLNSLIPMLGLLLFP
nr:hypothetical protein CFP56_06849 [Quercus suber]